MLEGDATARVLPWPECPQAIASAGRAVGEPVSALRSLLAADFTGTSTCTHLNDVLRSLAGVTSFAAALIDNVGCQTVTGTDEGPATLAMWT